jgi:hypothetical protein
VKKQEERDNKDNCTSAANRLQECLQKPTRDNEGENNADHNRR